MQNSTYRTHSEHWQRTVDFQKGKSVSLEWSRAKDKDKKGGKRFQNGDLSLGRQSWRRKSFHTLGNPLTGRVMGELQNLRGNCNNEFRDRCSEGNAEDTHQRDCCGTALPNWEAAHMPALSGGWVPRLRLQDSNLRERTGLTSMKILRESREKHGPTREAKDHSQGYSLNPHAHRHRTPP